MRVFRLILLGLIAFVVSILFLFPAAPVVERVKPLIQPVVLENVGGKVLNGTVARVSYDDGVFPLELNNVTWRLAPQKLLSLMAGVDFTFEAYGGEGQGEFANSYNGDMEVTDVIFTGPAKGLEALLPLPIAEFTGDLDINVESVEIRNQLLSSMRGSFVWNDAVLESPIKASFGKINLDIKPTDEQTHRGFIEAAGGELDIKGTIDLKLNGDFRADVLVTPKSDASPELLNALRGIARADNSGRFRIQQNGNVNRLM